MTITWESAMALATIVASLFTLLTFIIKKNKELSEIGGRVQRLEDIFGQMQTVSGTLTDIKVSIAVITESLKKITEICNVINEHDHKIDDIDKRVNTLECVKKA